MSSSFSTISALCPVQYLQAATDEMTYLTHFFRHFNIRNGISSILVPAFDSDRRWKYSEYTEGAHIPSEWISADSLIAMFFERFRPDKWPDRNSKMRFYISSAFSLSVTSRVPKSK